MSPLPPQDLGHGITCIDTLQERPGMAACYLVQRGDELAFVETGTAPGVPRLLALLAERGLEVAQVRYVILTHVHLDHAGGAGALMAALPKATLIVHPRGARHMADPAKLIAGATAVYGAEAMAAMYGRIEAVPESRIHAVADGEALPLGPSTLVCIDTPGHARHHLSVWDADSKGFFTGDTFGLSYREFDGPRGPWIMPTTTPVQFEPEAWLATIDRYLGYAPQCLYFTHYGTAGKVPELAAHLKTGLARYCEIGQRLKAVPDRHAALKKALMDEALADLVRWQVPVSATRATALLENDIELNAQGLGIWLDQKAA